MSNLCTYAISGQYGPVSRYVYYALLALSLLGQRFANLVGGTLGLATLCSSIAAVHALALTTTRGRSTLDADVLATFNITSIGLLVGPPMLRWNRALRESAKSVRLVWGMWTVLMWVGSVGGAVNIRAIAAGSECSGERLGMRRGQTPREVEGWGGHSLGERAGGVVAAATVLAVLGYAGARGGEREREREEEVREIFVREKKGNGAERLVWRYLIPLAAVGMAVAQAVVMEGLIRDLPMEEHMENVGQWGPLAGAAVAFIGSMLKWFWASVFDEKEVREREGAAEDGSCAAEQHQPPAPCMEERPYTATTSRDVEMAGDTRSWR